MAAVMMAYPVRDSFQGYPQQYSMYQTRAHQPQVDVAQSLSVNPYANFQSAPETQQYIHPQTKTHQPAPSMITEDGFRPSLPSISNLLGIADGERGSQDGASQQAQPQTQTQSQQQQPVYQQSAMQAPNEQRQQPTYQHQDLSSSQRTAVPPTPPPPLRNDSVVEGTHSPSTISTGSSLSIPHPFFLGSSLNNVEATDQRAAAAAQFMKRPSVPSQPNTSPYGTSPYTSSPYTHSPGGLSNGSYYSPTEPSYAGSGPGIYHQRPLPSNFPPPPPMPVQSVQSMPSMQAPTTRNIWEHTHHHYISPSSQSIFPQTQDRYVCPTCNKAFSRPSSLKIHSNSHTGEKPYKCPHAGCGKAFSVRSNMKRHQRGCHTDGSGLLGPSHLR